MAVGSTTTTTIHVTTTTRPELATASSRPKATVRSTFAKRLKGTAYEASRVAIVTDCADSTCTEGAGVPFCVLFCDGYVWQAGPCSN
jgi:hypothetical protein